MQMFRFLFLLLSLALVVRADEKILTERDVEYGKVNGKALKLDIYRPAEKAAKPRKAIILVHGGGWNGGDKRDLRGKGERLAKHGFVAISVGYRLVFGEEGRWPAALDDVQRAVRWVRANAGRLEIDATKLGALGESAGGHLVMFLGTRETRDNSDAALAAYSSRVQCVVDIYGPSDLNHDFSKKVLFGLMANELIRNLLGGTPAEKPDAARDASPINQVNAKSAPFLIFHGGRDRLVPVGQSEILDAALKKAGVESKFVLFPEEDHGFAKPANQQTMHKETLAFLQRHLQP